MSHISSLNPTSANSGEPSGLLSSTAAMARLGYRNRGAFWDLVYRQAVPHVRINARVIRFPPAALDHWIRQRQNAA